MGCFKMLKNIFWILSIVTVTSIMITSTTELELSEFHREQTHKLLIDTITPNIPSDKYIFTTIILSKSRLFISRSPHILHQERRETIASALLQYLKQHISEMEIQEISIDLIPTEYPLQSSYYLIIVFSHKHLISEISEFIASESLQHLYFCIEEPTIKRVINIKTEESWTLIENASEFHARRRLLSHAREQFQASQTPALHQRAATWSRQDVRSPLTGYISPSENRTQVAQAQNFNANILAAQIALYLERFSHSQSLQQQMDRATSSTDPDLESDYEAPQTRTPPTDSDFDQTQLVRPRRKRSVTFVGESAESDVPTRPRNSATLFGNQNADCQVYTQWLFFSWVIIGMLVTTNIVTCVFACWARENATSLTDKAFTLAMAIKENKYEHSMKTQLDPDEHIHFPRDSLSIIKPEIAKSYTGNHGNQHSVPVPLQRTYRNNTYHGSSNVNINHPSNRKQQIVQLPVCSPIPSTYSKSYSYGPPLAALNLKSSPIAVSRQASQPLFTLSPYHRLSPSDQQLRSFLNKQNNAGHNVASPFRNADIDDSQPNELANHEEDDEKQDVVNNSPQNSNKESSDSSLMYQNDSPNNNAPGTTKGKLKDGESSVYSPSSKSKRKRESPTQ